MAAETAVSRLPTPELDRFQAAIAPQKVNDTLTSFYDWLRDEKGYVIAEYGVRKARQVRCRACNGRGIDPAALTPRQRQLVALGQFPDHEWPPCPDCDDGWVTEEYTDPESLAPIGTQPADLFADFLGLDPLKMEEEKRALLDALREDNGRREADAQ